MPDLPTDSRTRRRVLLGAIAAVGAAAGAALGWRNHMGSNPPGVPESFWQMQFDTPGGPPLPMQSLRGRPLLINFWATWCPPCVEELPLLDGFFKSNAANGWQVLGIAIDQKAAVQSFLSRSPVSFSVVLAGLSGAELARTLGNVGGALPFSVVLGSNSELVQRKLGRVTSADLNTWAQLR